MLEPRETLVIEDSRLSIQISEIGTLIELDQIIKGFEGKEGPISRWNTFSFKIYENTYCILKRE